MWALPAYYHKVFKTDRFRCDSVLALETKSSVLFPIWHPGPTAAQLIRAEMPPRCSEWEVSTSFWIILGQGCPDAKNNSGWIQFWIISDPRLPRRYCLETSGRDLEGPKRVSIEMTSTRNGCGTTPKGPIGPSPKDPPRPIRPLNPMCLYPNYSGAFGPATPKSPLPQGDARSAFDFLIKFWYHFRNFDFRFWTVSAGGRHVLAEGYRLKSHESP